MTLEALPPLRAALIRSEPAWRGQLLSADSLAKRAEKLGVGSFRAEDILGLWKIGLLRADVVWSKTALDSEGLLRLGIVDSDDSLAYLDTRQLEHRSQGYGSSLECTATGGMVPAFHLYRLYVLHHVKRTLEIKTSCTQYLVYEPGVMTVTERLLVSKRSWTSSESFRDRFHYWNQVSEIAAVADAFAHDVVHGDESPLGVISLEKRSCENELISLFRALGKPAIHTIRHDLAFAAHWHDENRRIHVLLRLMKASQRNELRGRLGGAMLLLSMAESIRRLAEEVFKERLPEEDEIGGGTWFPGARKMCYGSDRVFDSPKLLLRDYLSQFGLDVGIKVRCYVEGDTEFGALFHATGQLGHVQIVNLRGVIGERGGRGLAFADSLAADKRSGLFSVVVLDGDRSDYLRSLRIAAKDERFHGRYFINEPDIEFQNFTLSELLAIALRMCDEYDDKVADPASVRSAILAQEGEIRSGDAFFAALRRLGLTKVRKSEGWGRALMEHAIESPDLPTDSDQNGELRRLFEIAKLLVHLKDVAFFNSLACERVDPSTGHVTWRDPVKRWEL